MKSIATKAGDGGETSLLFGRRVSKADIRIEANGCVDELNVRLGLVKAALSGEEASTKVFIERVQNNLVNLMGEVAVAPEDWARYEASGMPNFDAALLGELDARVTQLEEGGFSFKGWATPGRTPQAAAFDSARTACRAAETALVRVHEAGLLNPGRAGIILASLNRLSDALWLEARRQESLAEARTSGE